MIKHMSLSDILTGSCEAVDFELKIPFSIFGHVFTDSNTVQVTLNRAGVSGRGEGIGVYYNDDTAEVILDQLCSVLADLSYVKSVDDIQELLPPGGARNALDCAFWDLLAKQANTTIWKLLDIRPKSLPTVYTIGIHEPAIMAEQASASKNYPHLKLKLGNDRPLDRVKAVRKARPDAQIIIDVNQGWSFDELKEYAPRLRDMDIAMIEQPLKRGGDVDLEDYISPVPLGADESCLHSGEFASVVNRYDVINIKLDKTGGLTEALKLAGLARRAEKSVMIGNMVGTSLSMAPAFVIGQFAQFVDLDGPLLLKQDIEYGLEYSNGIVSVPSSELWG